ncbi:putative methyltransferase [Planktothrix serta PCC 8927]|uniref:Methyltransferase n=1 Tax=Planktothrix serta PCC 8927 TaxID=671068 RepID=A0A7Z9BN65_9CYAN|nr:class I SAM-dependent methyltransferase [Planktothrix serta]VXD16229.1 putative methyltransferase [Planktothrix serta PCC 8927]
MDSNPPLKIQGCLGDVTLEQDHVCLKGWVTSIAGEPIEGFKLIIGDQEITQFKLENNLPSPDVYQLFPTLPNSNQARFLIHIPLEVIAPEQFNHLVQLIPLVNGEEGEILFNLLESSLPVPEKEDRLGVGGSFKFVACDFLGHFINKAQLKPHESILDAGCGVGRIAYSLAYYLDDTARYEGFDIVEKWINWNQSVIHQHRPNFNFQWANIYNKRYNTEGTIKVENYSFPYADEQFDFVFLTSVFTHLYANAVQNYLKEIYRVLKPGGRCLCTLFLLNEESEALIKSGKSSQNLIHEIEDSFCSDLEIPEASMGHRETSVMQWVEALDFTVSAKYYGLWCGRTPGTSYQDMLILKKPK